MLRIIYGAGEMIQQLKHTHKYNENIQKKKIIQFKDSTLKIDTISQ